MTELLETISSEWALRALAASSMVGVMCGVIGCFIVLRNMSLIGDALSHAILPGIFIAFIVVGYSTIGFFVGSVMAGLLTALVITWLQQNIQTKNDAAIGIVFTAMFSIGVIGISWLSQEQGAHLDLKDFLFGNVLGISTEDIIITAAVTVYTLLSVVILFRYLFISTFQSTIAATMGISVKAIHYFLMLLLSFAVVSALRSVGVILVVAMLITPASTALLISDRLRTVLIWSGFIGLLSAVSGMILAIYFDTTPGPAMVLVTTLVYFMVAIFAPEKGYFTRFLIRREEKNRIEREDIIKLLAKSKSPQLSEDIANVLGLSIGKVKKHINHLEHEKHITGIDGKYVLDYRGEKAAAMLIRAHRLWESYQVNTMGLNEEQIHDEAERLEHLLSQELIDEVDEKLGYPTMDPHGSPIPPKKTKVSKSLSSLKPNVLSVVSSSQPNQYVESELWELGLMANSHFIVKSKNQKYVKIDVKGKSIRIPSELASEIAVD